MDFVPVLPNLHRSVHFMTAALCLLSALQAGVASAECNDFSKTVGHLLRPSSTPTPTVASRAARPGDILDYLDELPLAQRQQYQTLITTARRQVPPIRGLETYERVLFTAIQTNSDPNALLNTLIPTEGGRENVVADMIRHLEEHPPCHPWSVCGDAGDALFSKLMRERRASSRLPSVREQIRRNPSLAPQAAAEQSALLARLREIQQAGEIRYEDLIRLSVEYAHHNRLNFDVRRLDRPDFVRANAVSAFWSTFHNYIASPPGSPNRKTVTSALLDPDRLRRAVITVSTHPFDELEIAPAGFMITPIELAATPVIADKVPRSSLENAAHDQVHRDTMVGETRNHHDLHDLAYQLQRLAEWEPFDQLNRELIEEAHPLRALVPTYVFNTWHEDGDPLRFLNLYLYMRNPNLPDPKQRAPSYLIRREIAQHLENQPRWAREVARGFSRRLTQELGMPRAVRRTGVSISRRMDYFANLLPHLYEEWRIFHGVRDESERWNSLIAYASSPAMQRRPLERLLLRLLISRVGRSL